MKKVLRIIMYISLCATILLSVVDYCCFDKSFYYSEDEKLKIADYIGISDEDMKILTDVTLDYLRDADLTLDVQLTVKGVLREVYNEKEKSHMVDVRNLYQNAMKFKYIFMIITIAIFAYTMLDKTKIKEYYDSYKKSLLGIGLFLSLIGFFVFLNFDEFWWKFHEIFFPNNMNWLLDSRKDILVMFVPGEFFNDLVVRIISITVISVFVIFVILKVLSVKIHED